MMLLIKKAMMIALSYLKGMVDVAGMVWGDAAGTLTLLNP